MARAASEIIDVKSWWIRLCNGVSVVAFEPVQERTRRTRRERTPFLLGHFTLSQFLLGSSSRTLQANQPCWNVAAFMPLLTAYILFIWVWSAKGTYVMYLLFLFCFLFQEKLSNMSPSSVQSGQLTVTGWSDSSPSAQRDIWQKFALTIFITSSLL